MLMAYIVGFAYIAWLTMSAAEHASKIMIKVAADATASEGKRG